MAVWLRRGSFVFVAAGVAATTFWYLAIRLPPVPRRPLLIGFEHNPPTLIRTPSGFAGLAVETVSEAAKRAGVQLRWVETGTSSDEAFQKRLVDLWPLMANLPDRRKRVHFTRLGCTAVTASLCAPTRCPPTGAMLAASHFSGCHFTFAL